MSHILPEEFLLFQSTSPLGFLAASWDIHHCICLSPNTYQTVPEHVCARPGGIVNCISDSYIHPPPPHISVSVSHSSKVDGVLTICG